MFVLGNELAVVRLDEASRYDPSHGCTTLTTPHSRRQDGRFHSGVCVYIYIWKLQGDSATTQHCMQVQAGGVCGFDTAMIRQCPGLADKGRITELKQTPVLLQ